MYLQKVHLYRVVLRRMWQLEIVWSGMLYNYYQKVRHVLRFSSCGIRQPSFLLAHRWDLESWGWGRGLFACQSPALLGWGCGLLEECHLLLCSALLDVQWPREWWFVVGAVLKENENNETQEGPCVLELWNLGPHNRARLRLPKQTT